MATRQLLMDRRHHYRLGNILHLRMAVGRDPGEILEDLAHCRRVGDRRRPGIPFNRPEREQQELLLECSGRRPPHDLLDRLPCSRIHRAGGRPEGNRTTTRPGFRTTSRRTPPRRCPCRPAAPRSRPGVPRGFRLRDRCLRSYGSTWASTTGSRPANGRCHRIRWLHRCPKPHPSNRSPFQHHQHHQYRQHHPHHHCRRCRQPPVST